ncbi:MAG TPA: hypothetical protein VF041_19370 [Gemmatimonadaceae bacterium]
MRIIVETAERRERVPVRHVAQLLSGLLTVYAGVALAVDPGSAEEIFLALNAGSAEEAGDAGRDWGVVVSPIPQPPGGGVLRALEQAGRTVLEGDEWPRENPRLQALVTSSLARRWSGGDALVMGVLGTGSVYGDIEIARDLDRLRRGFERIVRKIGSVLPWRPDARTDEIKDAVREVVPGGPTALAGAGVIGVGVSRVVGAAVGLGGTGIVVD